MNLVTLYVRQQKNKTITWNTEIKIKPNGVPIAMPFEYIGTEMPSNPVTGSIYFDTTTASGYLWDGMQWIMVTQSAPMSQAQQYGRSK